MTVVGGNVIYDPLTTGSLTVVGNLSANTATITGNVTVTGNITLNGSDLLNTSYFVAFMMG
jgi:hypothetical protein